MIVRDARLDDRRQDFGGGRRLADPTLGLPVDSVVGPVLRDIRMDNGDVNPTALKTLWQLLPEIASQQLRDMAAAAIGMPAASIALRQISGQGAKGVSGTPVDLIETTGPNPKPLGILKIAFGEGYAREVGSMVYLNEDLDAHAHMHSSAPHVLEMAKTVYEGRPAGIMVMELADGHPMDDLMTAARDANPEAKTAAEATFLRGVGAGADALAEWHTQAPGSGTHAPMAYLQRYQDKVKELLEDLGTRFKGQVDAMGLSMDAIHQAADQRWADVQKNPGLNGLTHGDAHPGNVIYHDGAEVPVTLIDFNRLHQSLDHSGAPTGSPARDVVRYWYGLRWFGELFGLSPELIKKSEDEAMQHFKASGAPQTPEGMKFFRLHAALDLLHFSLGHESAEVNARMENFHYRNIMDALQGGGPQL